MSPYPAQPETPTRPVIRKMTMTRISSLFVATTLAILPIAAFAQQNVAPAKNAAPVGMTAMAPTGTAPITAAPTTEKTSKSPTAKVIQPANPDVRNGMPGAKARVHGMNTVRPSHAKPAATGKIADPAES